MSNTIAYVDNQTLTNIADAVRYKTGTNEKMLLSDIPDEIRNLDTSDITALDTRVTAVEGDVSDLKEDLNEVADEFGAIAPYKTYSDSYIDSTGAVVSAVGFSIYEIPVKYGDVIFISDRGASKFYGLILLGNVFNFKNDDNTYTHLGTGYDTKFVIRTDQDDYMLVIPSGVKCLAVSADDNYYQNVSFRKNYATADFNGMLLKKSGVVSRIDSSWIISSNFYPRSSDDTFRVLTSNVFALAVKSGDIVEFQSLVSPYTYYGTFKDKSTLDVANITTAIFTAQSDGYVFAFGDNTSGIVYKPYNGIKIDKRSIVGLGKILDNKVYCAFGDSITAGNNLQTGEVNWTNLVVNELGGTLVNCGVGSSRVAGNQSTAFHKDNRLNDVKAANPDIVTIMGGANDLVAGYAIGDESQFILPLAEKNTMTYLGSYSYVIESLLTWKPSLQIVILGMYYAYTDGTEYSDTLTYQMLSDASEKLAKHYCLPFVDLHHDTGFNQFTMGTSPNNIYTRDRIHPNQLGCNKIASIVIDKFKEVFST